jgi:hypothetical protein
MTIVTYAHRPKRQPRKRAKAAAIEAPAIVRGSVLNEGKRKVEPPATDGHKSAIVTARRPATR